MSEGFSNSDRQREAGGDPAAGRLLDTEAAVAERLALGGAEHVAPLNDLARRIARRHGEAPLFDPLDGGTGARLLFLMETPGPSLARARFVSRDNRTGTGRNLRRFFAAAGIRRADTVLWNAVPWIIHAPGARNRAPTQAEVADGVPWLEPLLGLLPRLRVVVMAGRSALAARPFLEARDPGLLLFHMPHPSPVYVCTDPAIAERIVLTLGRAREALDGAAVPLRRG